VNDFGQLVAHALFNTENAKYLFKTKRFLISSRIKDKRLYDGGLNPPLIFGLRHS
jgi:hypothetical protein